MNATITKPRARLTPSPRDQQIYLDYQVQGLTQTQLAKNYEVSQRRISQILHRVQTWRDATAAASQSEICNLKSEIDSPKDSLAAENLDRRLIQGRLDFAARQAARAWQKPQITITKRTGSRGDKPLDETTERTAPPNIQCLKVIIQSTRQHAALCNSSTFDRRHSTFDPDGRGSPDPAPSVGRGSPDPAHSATEGLPPGTDDRRTLLEDLLTDLMDEAVHADKIRTVGWDTEREFVEDLCKFLLGEPHSGLATRIIACDAEHGRLRSNENMYPGHDPMLMSTRARPVKCDVGRGSPDPAHSATEGLLSDPDNSVPGSLEPQNPEAPASSFNPEPQATGEPEICNVAPETTSSTSCAPAPDRTQPQPRLPLPVQNQKSKIQNPPSKSPDDDALARTDRHYERLDLLHKARAAGLSYLLYFHPADGPLPSPPAYVLDGAP